MDTEKKMNWNGTKIQWKMNTAMTTVPKDMVKKYEMKKFYTKDKDLFWATTRVQGVEVMIVADESRMKEIEEKEDPNNDD